MSKRNTIPLNEVSETLDQLNIDQKETNRLAQKRRTLEAAANFMQQKTSKPVEFPLQAFPTPIRTAIQHWVDVTNLNVEHFGTAVLSAAGVAIGNKLKVKVREGWTEPALLYCIVLGSSGVGKTPIWNYAMRAILQIEKENYEDYVEDLRQYKSNRDAMADRDMDFDEDQEPRVKKLRVEKIATETLLEQMWSNPHGLFLFRDELRSWFMSLNQGSGRDDVELFLEFWNNSSKVKDLKSSTFYIERTALNILGGLQPELMKQIATGTNVANGLFQRFLCAYPFEQIIQEELSDEQADEDICQMYDDIIVRLYEMEDYLERPRSRSSKPSFRNMVIPMSPECYERWHEYYGEISRRIKKTEDDNIISTIRKHDKHVSRIALILRMLRYSDEASEHTSPREPEWIEANLRVEVEDMENAILLSRYYLYQSMRILDAVATPAHGLKANYQLWYHSLNDSFNRKEAVDTRDDLKKQYGKDFSLSNGTIAKLLNDRQLFRKRPGSNGHYDKLWEL